MADRRTPDFVDSWKSEYEEKLKKYDEETEDLKKTYGYESLSDDGKKQFLKDRQEARDKMTGDYYANQHDQKKQNDTEDANDNDQSQDRGDHEIGHSKNKKEQGEEYEI